MLLPNSDPGLENWTPLNWALVFLISLAFCASSLLHLKLDLSLDFFHFDLSSYRSLDWARPPLPTEWRVRCLLVRSSGTFSPFLVLDLNLIPPNINWDHLLLYYIIRKTWHEFNWTEIEMPRQRPRKLFPTEFQVRADQIVLDFPLHWIPNKKSRI